VTKLAIRGARLFDGTGAAPIEKALVLVENGRIAWVGPAAAAPGSLADYTVIEAAGGTILPGLINCHVHLTSEPDPRFLTSDAINESLASSTLRAARNARLALEAGETTLRDLGAAGGVVIDLARAIAQGLVPGPRVVPCGAVVTMTGGHCWFIGREADGCDEVRKAVREQLKAGAEVIKLMATGGVMTKGVEAGAPGLSEEELAAGIREAHNAGRKTATHAIGTQGIKNALRAGIDSVEHGALLDDEGLELLLKRDAYLVPTLSAVHQIVSHAERGEMDEYVTRKARSIRDRHFGSFKMAVAAGAKIAAGTDAGTPYNTHGGLALELELMVQNGFTPTQALVAATSSAADLLNLADRIGTVEAGKAADLLVVAGDPTREIGAVRDVRTVVVGGKVAVQK
jgi:imidazolonepropionase-like amidohydrolase